MSAIDPGQREAGATGRLPLVVFLAALVAFAGLLVLAVVGLPSYLVYEGPYGMVLQELAVEARHATHTVSAVLYDMRSFDTLGEVFALFTASTGAVVLLREMADEEEIEPRSQAEDRIAPPTSDAVRLLLIWLVPVTLLFGIYTVVRGHVTVGGGFQGGAVLGSGLVLLHLAGRYRTLRRLTPEDPLDAVESLSAAAYVVVGLIALVGGGAFLANTLPLGQAGELLSAGTIPVLSIIVGLEVGAATTLITVHLMEQQLEIRMVEEDDW